MEEVNQNRKCILTAKLVISILVGVFLTAGIVIGTLIITKKKDFQEKYFASLSQSQYEYKPDTYKLCQTKPCLKQATRILKNMDASVNPCTDFYNFTCGNFMRYTQIPKDQTRLTIALENKKIVEAELIKAYNAEPTQFNSLIQDMKTFYHQCINSETYKNETYNFLKEILLKLNWPVFNKNWIRKSAPTFDWLKWEAQFSGMGLAAVFLTTEIKFDMRNFSLAYIGLDCTVPTLTKNKLSRGKRGKYVKEYRYVIKEFLKIITRDYRGNVAEEIVDFFLKVEQLKPTSYEMSDANFFHAFKNITIGVLEKQLKIDLEGFLKKVLPSSVAITKSTILGTSSHQCLHKMTSMLKASDKRHIANYMMWRAVQNMLWILSNETRQLDFRLKKAKTGIQAPLPLYKLCLNFIDEHIPEISSAMYVKMFYSNKKKNDLEQMVKLLLKELQQMVNEATWMAAPTKKIAQEKVKRLSYIIDHTSAITKDSFLYETYGKLKMTLPSLIENIKNIRKAAYYHMMESYNWTPTRRNAVTLLPLAHFINANYHPGLNSIGITHGSIYAHDQEAYLNFGAIGIIIGHELLHMFDNVGRLYDANGKYVNWWSNESNSKFEEKSRCFEKQYNNYKLGPNQNINGTLTLGENMANTGGTLLAYRSYLKWMKKYEIKKLPGLEKYNLKQLFWITVGNTWCDKLRPEALEMFLTTDVHLIGKYRVLGPLSNSEEFSRDFKCPLNSEMNPTKKCTIW